MLADYAARLQRTKWSTMGLSHLAGKDPQLEDALKAIDGLGSALDSLVDELSTMLQSETPLTHRQPLTILDNNPNIPPTINATGGVHTIDDAEFLNVYHSFGVNNPHSRWNPVTEEVEGGYSQVNKGVTNLDSLIVNDIINPDVNLGVVGDEEWIHVVTTANVATVSHVGPGGQGTPATIGDDSEGAEDANTDDADTGTNGINEWYVSRVVYDNTGDKVLYQMMRMRSYDKRGHLMSISGETRVEVNAATACS